MQYLLAYFNPEMMMIGLVALLVLCGGKKIPELMRGIGQGVGELKKGVEEGQRSFMTAVHHEASSTSAASTQVAEPTPAIQPSAETVAHSPVAQVATSSPAAELKAAG